MPITKMPCPHCGKLIRTGYPYLEHVKWCKAKLEPKEAKMTLEEESRWAASKKVTGIRIADLEAENEELTIEVGRLQEYCNRLLIYCKHPIERWGDSTSCSRCGLHENDPIHNEEVSDA